MDIRVDKPPPWDLELQAAEGTGDRRLGGGGGLWQASWSLTAVERPIIFFVLAGGSDDSCWKLASATTSAASFVLRDSVSDSEVARQEVPSGTEEKKVNSRIRKLAEGAGFSQGLKTKTARWCATCGKEAVPRSARSYLLLPLEQQTDYVTDYDSEYDSCSSRPFVCLSRWLTACFSACLSVCLSAHAAACRVPGEPLGDPDYPHIFLRSRMCKKKYDIIYNRNIITCTAAKNINMFFNDTVDVYCF